MGFALLKFIQVFFLCLSIKAYSSDYVVKPSKSNKDVFHRASVFLSTDTIIKPAKSSTIIAPGAKIQLVSSQFSFTEGPAANKKGDVFFTDQPNDKIWKYDTEGKLSLFLDKSGRSNGLYFDKKGNLISCADEKNELWSIAPSGKVTVLLKDFKGARLNGPNDLWVDKKGGIYFTDPYYQRPYWDRNSPDIKSQNVYHLAKGSKEPIVVDSNLLQPNGIIGTKDRKYLYVSDIRDKKTYRYSINAVGRLIDRQLFTGQGSDGMAIDNKGNIYLTGNGVTVYNSGGEKIEHIAVPSKWTANVCFGGKNNNILFVTASESVYTLQMKVKGGE